MSEQRSGVVALVGRPNVGKSTLFNRLCQRRDAIVYNRPGLTRDRNYGQAHSIRNADVTLIDTGGMHDEMPISPHIDQQVLHAIDESHLVVFVTDAREGLTPIDQQIAGELRKSSARVLLAINKIDGLAAEQEIGRSEFASLGFDAYQISATHGQGFREFTDSLVNCLPRREVTINQDDRISIAAIGRPNVGKSSLVNVLSNAERCLVFDAPGTTRDVVKVDIHRNGVTLRLIDTAGIRRKGRTRDVVEKFSIVKALEALKIADIALLLIDANEGIVEQDLHLIDYAIEARSAVILVANKWDLVPQEERERTRTILQRRLRFAPWISVRYVSARTRRGTGALFSDIERVFHGGALTASPSDLTEILTSATRKHAPPAVGRHTIRLRYAHKVASHPPIIMIHGNQTEKLPAAYVRYLENVFRQKLGVDGWPLLLQFRTSMNPFGDRKNLLTPRQQRHRARLIKHRKSN